MVLHAFTRRIPRRSAGFSRLTDAVSSRRHQAVTTSTLTPVTPEHIPWLVHRYFRSTGHSAVTPAAGQNVDRLCHLGRSRRTLSPPGLALSASGRDASGRGHAAGRSGAGIRTTAPCAGAGESGLCRALGRATNGLAAGAGRRPDPTPRQCHGVGLPAGTPGRPQHLARTRRLWAPRISPKKVCPGAPSGEKDVILAVSERLNLERAGVRRDDIPARLVWFKDRLLPRAVLDV